MIKRLNDNQIDKLSKESEEYDESDLSDKSDRSEDLFEHFRFTVDKGQSLFRIDKFLVNRMENASRSRIQNAARAGNIFVNNIAIKPNYRVKPGDVISIVLPGAPRETELIPENIPIEIVFEDNDIIVVNKRAGMVVHPAHGNYSGTLVNALAYHLQNNRIEDLLKSTNQQIAKSINPFLVHRIDKNTSGILLIAKNELAQAKLAKQFFDHSIERTYVALVWGDMLKDEGTITGHVGRHPKNRKMMTVFPTGESGKHAVTHYKVIERFRYVTLIECRLETGRTHQIRTHLKYIKHPIFNDNEYGGDDILKGTTFAKYKQFVNNCFKILPRQALHARSLGFIHPSTGKFIFFDSSLPEDMAIVIDKWRKYLTVANTQ